MEKEIVLKEMEISDQILDVIYHQDEFTTSDLQGTISSIVYKAIKFGIEQGKKIKESEVKNEKI